MAVKRAKKKSSTMKDDELEMDKIGDGGRDNLQEDVSSNSREADKKESNRIITYKTYDADVEFKLNEIPSKNDEILIGPARLTRFEKARITGARSLQLSLGAPILTKIPPEFTDTIMIAKYELEKKTLPISIRRILPNGLYQDIPIEWTI
ncbi:DNA-directed RNA polymerase subunit K [Candidatus Nitrosocosmicus arcticus]|uniref:DNA-directed RNA polymerase subunit K (Rpo6) n=1 Tax=Candidatus Nitrosocosmicus arcticus TaxID=2035267 RepID=A0A557STF1_9ARCH|nr:DNA-directed RNA polymerase subunit K [Candidatus Nitrosocosmicus arcticus]TVP39883.1 DNA-directed RNA polymerase subunit K (Rpo6) [Candidatus Nitrosocosmicus arcticus]